MKRWYDSDRGAVLCIEDGAGAEVWNRTWSRFDITKAMQANLNDRLIVQTTQRHLEKGSVVLDGGCGLGIKVNCLDHHGYRGLGLDFALETLRRSKAEVPDLQLQYGSVTDLPYENNSLDGYWSLGVIEHFVDGYEEILDEMMRCLRPGGILFLTYPCMSFLRKVKLSCGAFPREGSQEGFYQYLLDPGRVTLSFRSRGLTLLEQKGMDAMKGFKDEVPALKPLLQWIYDQGSFPCRAFSYGLSQVLQGFSPHSLLQVYRKD